MLLKAAKANAALDGRDHALPDDVQALAEAVLAHRLLLAPEAVGTPREAIVRDAARPRSRALGRAMVRVAGTLALGAAMTAGRGRRSPRRRCTCRASR